MTYISRIFFGMKRRQQSKHNTRQTSQNQNQQARPILRRQIGQRNISLRTSETISSDGILSFHSKQRHSHKVTTRGDDTIDVWSCQRNTFDHIDQESETEDCYNMDFESSWTSFSTHPTHSRETTTRRSRWSMFNRERNITDCICAVCCSRTKKEHKSYRNRMHFGQELLTSSDSMNCQPEGDNSSLFRGQCNPEQEFCDLKRRIKATYFIRNANRKLI